MTEAIPRRPCVLLISGGNDEEGEGKMISSTHIGPNDIPFGGCRGGHDFLSKKNILYDDIHEINKQYVQMKWSR